MEPDPVNVSPLPVGMMLKLVESDEEEASPASSVILHLLAPVMLCWCAEHPVALIRTCFNGHAREHLLRQVLPVPQADFHRFSSTSIYSFLFANLGLHFLSKHPVKTSKKRNWLWSRRAFFQIFLYYILCFSLG